MTPSSAATWWQYISDLKESAEQYSVADLTGTKKTKLTAGVGLILDTRQNEARVNVKKIEKELAEFQGKARLAHGEELQEVGALQNPALKDLRDRLGIALIEQQAAKEDDGVVVQRQHKEGAAFKSGRIRNGHIITKVDGEPVGLDLAKCGQLIRGEVETVVTLYIRTPTCLEEEEVTLKRSIIPDHPTGPLRSPYNGAGQEAKYALHKSQWSSEETLRP